MFGGKRNNKIVLLAAAALTMAAQAPLARSGEVESSQHDTVAAEAEWVKFQAAVGKVAVDPGTPDLPRDGSPAEIAVLSDGVYGLNFRMGGHAWARTIRLPAALLKQIQVEFRPNYAQVAIGGARVTSITLIQAERGQSIRKITISLSDTERASNCLAALYPSGGNFFNLPVLLDQSCREIVAAPETYTSAL